MRALVQRVSAGSVSVDGEVMGKIDRGLVILLGVRNGDTGSDAIFLSKKCAHLRIFSDEAGKPNLSCLDVAAEALVVSQFTLYGDTSKGRRPSYIEAAPPDIAKPLYEHFMDHLQAQGLRVECGVFGAMMEVELINDGPVTLMLESR